MSACVCDGCKCSHTKWKKIYIYGKEKSDITVFSSAENLNFLEKKQEHGFGVLAKHTT